MVGSTHINSVNGSSLEAPSGRAGATYYIMSLVASLVAACGLPLSGYRPDYAYTFYKLAAASYCDSVESWTCKPCLESNQSLANITLFFNDTTDTRAYVGAYKDSYTQDMSIVLSFRGTETLENWIENLKLAKTDRQMSCAGCKVHSGFVDSWLSIAGPVLQQIRRLQQTYPGAKLYTTGHSLGAALAIVAAYVLEYDDGLDIEGVYTFGQPRVGNYEFAQYYNKHSSTHVTWRVTHHRDIVVHLPPKLFGFRHVANEVFYANDSRAESGYIVCDGSGEDGDCADRYHLTAVSIHDHLSYFGEAIGIAVC